MPWGFQGCLRQQKVVYQGHHISLKSFFHKNSIGSDNFQLKSMPYEECTGRTLFRGRYENIYG